jgi:hypothetical protein
LLGKAFELFLPFDCGFEGHVCIIPISGSAGYRARN